MKHWLLCVDRKLSKEKTKLLCRLRCRKLSKLCINNLWIGKRNETKRIVDATSGIAPTAKRQQKKNKTGTERWVYLAKQPEKKFKHQKKERMWERCKETAREQESHHQHPQKYYEYAIEMNGKILYNRCMNVHDSRTLSIRTKLERFVKDFRYVPFDSTSNLFVHHWRR